MSAVFDVIQKYYHQRDLTAREWKKNGGKVVGYFCDNVPDELILAAGFFPIRLSGDPSSGADAVIQYMSHPPEGFASSMLNMLLAGRYDFLDFLVIPHARDSIHRMYSFLVEMKASNPALKLPELYFFDSTHTPFYSSELYNRDRVFELKSKLEEWSMKEISDQSLSRAINIGNESKMLLKKIAELRAAEPPRISGVEALQIIGASMFMLKEEHNKLLRQYLKGTDKLCTREGVRLFVEGSPIDNLQFYEIVESCKATVVAEDNCWGNRHFDVPVNESLDPLEAVADRYHHKSPCPRMYPLSRRVKYCVGRAIEAKAQGVIFNILKFDDLQIWETPDEMKALEHKGIPSLYLKQQPYLISDANPIKASIEEFIGSIKKKVE